MGRLAELDGACQDAAVRSARAAGMRTPWTLFVNIEPETASVALLAPENPPPDSMAAAGRADAFGVVVELTERALHE